MAAMEFEDWVGKGQMALDSENLPEARRCFEMALKRDPLNAGLNNKLSTVHWKLGNLEAALSHLTQALEWDPNDREVILHCCNVFRATGRLQDAEEILNAYVERNPWDFEINQELKNLPQAVSLGEESFDAAGFFTEQGEKQFGNDRYDRARACFEMALEHNPNYAKAYSNLGVLSWQEGDLEQALEHLHKALQLDPQDFDILFNSSKALAAAGEFDIAADLLRLYLQHHPMDEAAWQEYNALLRHSGASQWNSDSLPKEVADVYLRMGAALAKAKDALGAGQAFQRAMQVDPSRPEPYYQLGRLHLELGQEAEALTIFREGLRLHPGHRESLVIAGKLLLHRGESDETMSLCEAFAQEHNHADGQAVFEEMWQSTRGERAASENVGNKIIEAMAASG